MFTRLQKLLPIKKIEGYEHPELIETIFQKTIAYIPTGPSPEFDAARTVLDFGGGCGIHYKQARLSSVRWAVVETPAMVARARSLETDCLRFFLDISSATDWLGHVDLMHSNGALQYTPEPLVALRELCGVRAAKMLWYRLHFSKQQQPEMQFSYLKDNGPGSLRVPRRRVCYHRTGISQDEFIAAHRGYRVAAKGDDWFAFVR